jgi:hypothetical protein
VTDMDGSSSSAPESAVLKIKDSDCSMRATERGPSVPKLDRDCPKDFHVRDGCVFWRGRWLSRPLLFRFPGGSMKPVYDESGPCRILTIDDCLEKRCSYSLELLSTYWSKSPAWEAWRDVLGRLGPVHGTWCLASVDIVKADRVWLS